MKALKYTILSLMFGGLVVSCDFLDKEPTKLTLDNYFTTADEASSFLTGIYAELGQSTFMVPITCIWLEEMTSNIMEV